MLLLSMDKKRRYKIVCGFPGVGKSFLSKNIGCNDSDSSKFDKRHFPHNYIRYIKTLSGIILVSTHAVVRDALFDNSLRFSICYPERSLKSEYIERYAKRGSSKLFLITLSKNWDGWISEMENERRATNHYVLKHGQYLSDIIGDVM